MSSKKKTGTRARRKRRDYGKPLEKTVQNSILKWLKKVGYVHWRQNSGFAFFGRRRIQLGPAGLPDIIVVLAPGGHFLGLEVKRPGRALLRDTQIKFKVMVESVGGDYRMVTSLKEAQAEIADAEERIAVRNS